MGCPGHYEGPVSEHSIAYVARAMPFVVGRKARAADGTTVVFEITGVAGRTLAIGMEGERAKPLDQPPALPTVHVTMDVETFACLGCGRWEPRQLLVSGKVRIEGDRALAKTIVTQMNFMP